jgi:hypothetical protein
LTSSFLIWIPFISFSCLIPLARNSKTILKRSGKSGQPCFVTDFKRNGFSCSPFNMMLALGLSYITCTMLRNILSISSFFRTFIMKGCWILSKAFSESIERILGVLSLLRLYAALYLQIYVCWTILASLEWNWLGHGVWSFSHVVEFYLPVFCWESLHLY